MLWAKCATSLVMHSNSRKLTCIGVKSPCNCTRCRIRCIDYESRRNACILMHTYLTKIISHGPAHVMSPLQLVCDTARRTSPAGARLQHQVHGLRIAPCCMHFDARLIQLKMITAACTLMQSLNNLQFLHKHTSIRKLLKFTKTHENYFKKIVKLKNRKN